jgi:hypothetical protein
MCSKKDRMDIFTLPHNIGLGKGEYRIPKPYTWELVPLPLACSSGSESFGKSLHFRIGGHVWLGSDCSWKDSSVFSYIRYRREHHTSSLSLGQYKEDRNALGVSRFTFSQRGDELEHLESSRI